MLLVLGVLLVLGGGACVVGGVLWFAMVETAAAPPVAEAALAHEGAGSSGGAEPLGGRTPSEVVLEPITDDGADEASPSPALPASAANGADAPAAPSDRAPGAPARRKYFCNATGYVRVCGFADVCSNHMVSGMGSDADRGIAAQHAKMACEGMARAKGGGTVCTVTCSLKS